MNIWSVTSCTSVNRGRMHYDFPVLHDLWLAEEKLLERCGDAPEVAFARSTGDSIRSNHELNFKFADSQDLSAA